MPAAFKTTTANETYHS